jgi:hypothetical protein
MGYNVQIISADAVIYRGDESKCLEALADLQERTYLYGAGDHFSWMPTDFIEECGDLETILEYLGFEEVTEDPRWFKLESYDNKRGQEHLFLTWLAPWIRRGGYGADDQQKDWAETPWIEWLGEDGARYRWEFPAGEPRMVNMEAHTTWSPALTFTRENIRDRFER